MVHSKKCLARSLIAAIENFRDDENISVENFRLRVGPHASQYITINLSNSALLPTAEYYLEDGLMNCTC